MGLLDSFNKSERSIANRVMQGRKKKLQGLNLGQFCPHCNNWNDKTAVYCDWCSLMTEG